VVYIVLPEGAKRKDLFSSQEADCNWAGHELEIVYLDSAVFEEQNERDWATVAHETLHALGLPDLYRKSSYGWSTMSDCRVAWHLLGWEKLLLGWVDLDDYIWLKRGLLSEPIYDLLTDTGNLKGVVIFDDVDNYAYVVEAAQPKGRTPAQRDQWNRHGLLLYRVELRSGSAQIAPVVSEWCDSEADGGAPLAPYPVPDIPTSPPALFGNVFLQVMGKGGDAAKPWIKAYVGNTTPWAPPQSATVLRAGEYIQSKSGQYRLLMTMDGQLEFQVKKDDKFGFASFWKPVPEAALDNNYGFFCQADRDGNVTVSQGAGPGNAGNQMWSWGKKFAPGHYFVWLVDTPTGCHVSVYSGRDYTDADSRKQGEKDLFDYPDDVTFGVPGLQAGGTLISQNHDYKLSMQTDGNLVVYKNDKGEAAYDWSMLKSYDDLKPDTSLGFSADGRLQLKASGVDKPIWQYKGEVKLDPNQDKRFFLSLDSNGAIAAYQGTWTKDSKKEPLYTVKSA
jgi:hypothetical protein